MIPYQMQASRYPFPHEHTVKKNAIDHVKRRD